MPLTVYGASDDLLEVDGDVREEFGHSDQAGRYVATSNGVVVKVTAADDEDASWQVRPVHDPAGLVTIVHARGEDAPRDDDGCPGYSDKAVITGDVAWVVVGTDHEQAR